MIRTLLTLCLMAWAGVACAQVFVPTIGQGSSLDALPDDQAIGFTTNASGTLRTSQTSGETLVLQAYDVDGAAWVSMATITAGNTPTIDLASNVTIGGSAPLSASGPTLTSATIGMAAGLVSAPSLSFGTIGVYTSNTANIVIATGSLGTHLFDSDEVRLASPVEVGWSSGTNAAAAGADVKLRRMAAGVLGVHNGTTNAAEFEVYRTRTDGSNFERVALQAAATYVEVAAETGGTGGDNLDVRLTPAGTGNVAINGPLNVTAATELTIASDAVTATKSYHTIDTQSDAASDDLATISGGTEGDVLTIRAINGARDVVVKDGTGNIQSEGDFTLDNVQDTISFIYDGSSWLETARANNGS